ncbi:uncharacterized protein LOC135650235 [Musa acuminata AAA Group]|uniref:uncharacterized protein LOC135650235 n=1 Tax=Musa acuminata AAA Group TaxID=214697 RepID=UPI0031DF047D
MSASSLMSAHGVVLATAVAVSGTVILIALRRQKPFSLPSATDPAPPPWLHLRSCMSSSEERKRARANRKKKKRVQFAAEVVEFDLGSSAEDHSLGERRRGGEGLEASRMPANRAALYNGILRDRGMQRMSCCY